MTNAISNMSGLIFFLPLVLLQRTSEPSWPPEMQITGCCELAPAKQKTSELSLAFSFNHLFLFHLPEGVRNPMLVEAWLREFASTRKGNHDLPPTVWGAGCRLRV